MKALRFITQHTNPPSVDKLLGGFKTLQDKLMAASDAHKEQARGLTEEADRLKALSNAATKESDRAHKAAVALEPFVGL